MGKLGPILRGKHGKLRSQLLCGFAHNRHPPKPHYMRQGANATTTNRTVPDNQNATMKQLLAIGMFWGLAQASARVALVLLKSRKCCKMAGRSSALPARSDEPSRCPL